MERPSYDRQDGVYIAGNFNDWKPGDAAYRFHESADHGELPLVLKPGDYEYKVTRGSWERGETDAAGHASGNRTIHLTKDTVIELQVAGWADHFPKKPIQSTAGKNVQVIDTAFLIPQLNRHRRIWICLPEDYATSRKSYPVLYMHDGQNLFDNVTSFSGEWGIDEALDSLSPHYGACIVVGIDNDPQKRLNEYSPYDMEKYGKGEGDQYVDFLVKTLKPFIDKHYRTKKDRAHTWIAGSSMGGLISYYAIVKYPNIYGAASVFSPAFWVAPKIKDLPASALKKIKGKIYFYAGGQESSTMVSDMLAVAEALRLHSKAVTQTVIRAEGHHTESAWRAEFPLFYQWIRTAGGL